jgi:hypothetical protein
VRFHLLKLTISNVKNPVPPDKVVEILESKNGMTIKAVKAHIEILFEMIRVSKDNDGNKFKGSDEG